MKLVKTKLTSRLNQASVTYQNKTTSRRWEKKKVCRLTFLPNSFATEQNEVIRIKFSADLHSTVIAFMLGNLWAMDSL